MANLVDHNERIAEEGGWASGSPSASLHQKRRGEGLAAGIPPEPAAAGQRAEKHSGVGPRQPRRGAAGGARCGQLLLPTRAQAQGRQATQAPSRDVLAEGARDSASRVLPTRAQALGRPATQAPSRA